MAIALLCMTASSTLVEHKAKPLSGEKIWSSSINCLVDFDFDARKDEIALDSSRDSLLKHTLNHQGVYIKLIIKRILKFQKEINYM
jgi:hypothetical protein